jgi:MoxR-like ATPase
MLVNFSKKDLTLETKGFISGMSVIKDDELGNAVNLTALPALEFEGFSGFNEKYAKPLIELLYRQMPGKASNVYKAIHVAGNLHNDSEIHEADFYIVKNVRDTMFLFKILKSFAITLPDLRLGYESEEGPEVLYLDKKILKVLHSLNDDAKRELVLYFYCLARFFRAMNKANPTIGVSTTGDLSIFEGSLAALYKEYGALPESFGIECMQLKEDVYFADMQYIHNAYIPFVKDIDNARYSSTFVYNVIKTKTSEMLCIVNTTTKDYYVINASAGTIYTNNELREFNTFDNIEWIPNLVINLASVTPSLNFYRVKYLKLEQLLSSKEPEVIISNDATNFESLLELYPNISENNNMKLYEGYFKGSVLKTEGGVNNLAYQYEKDEYAQKLYKQVQPYYETFDLKDLTGIVKGVANGTIFSMLFEGESGTGKSTAARVIASRCGLPFVAINCSTNIEESDIFGAMVPNPEKSSADDAEFVWQDGPLTKAIRYGYVGIIEELGFGRPGVLGKINSLLDESRQIDLPNGEVLKAHPNFRLIATTNIGYEGTNRLNKALVNRFEICKKFVDLDEKEAKAIIMSRTGYGNADKITKVLDVYRAIKKYSNEQNLGLVVSIRQLLNIFKQGKYYKTAKDAVNNLLLNQAFLEEPDHLEHFKDTVLNVFDLSFKL